MKIIVCEPVKIAGDVAKPGKVIDTDELRLSDEFVEELLISELVAEFQDADDSSDRGSGGTNPPPRVAMPPVPARRAAKKVAAKKASSNT